MRGSDFDERPRRRVLIALAGLLAVAVVWNVAGNLWLPGAWYVPANLLVAGVAVAIARSAGVDWGDLGLARRDAARGAVVGLWAMLVVAGVIAILVAIPASRSFFESDDVAADSSSVRWFTAVVRIPLGTAVFEEVLFRGALFALVLRLTSVRRTVVVTSIIFGLWHVVPSWEGASGTAAAATGAIAGTVAVTTVAGGLFAWLRLRSGSTVASILAHTATNSCAYVAAIVALDLA